FAGEAVRVGRQALHLGGGERGRQDDVGDAVAGAQQFAGERVEVAVPGGDGAGLLGGEAGHPAGVVGRGAGRGAGLRGCGAGAGRLVRDGGPCGRAGMRAGVAVRVRVREPGMRAGFAVPVRVRVRVPVRVQLPVRVRVPARVRVPVRVRDLARLTVRG